MNVYEVEYSYYHIGVCGTGRQKQLVVATKPLEAIEFIRQFWSKRHGVNFRQDDTSYFSWHQVKELESNVLVAGVSDEKAD